MGAGYSAYNGFEFAPQTKGITDRYHVKGFFMKRALQIYREYPRTFWMMIAVNFIDRLGGSLLFPFFALYITKKFDVGMTEVGGLFAIFFLSGFIGAFPGGALTDRFGRKGIIFFCLVATSFSTLFMGFVSGFQV